MEWINAPMPITWNHSGPNKANKQRCGLRHGASHPLPLTDGTIRRTIIGVIPVEVDWTPSTVVGRGGGVCNPSDGNANHSRHPCCARTGRHDWPMLRTRGRVIDLWCNASDDKPP